MHLNLFFGKKYNSKLKDNLTIKTASHEHHLKTNSQDEFLLSLGTVRHNWSCVAPSVLGIDGKIVCANIKYYSSLMCTEDQPTKRISWGEIIRTSERKLIWMHFLFASNHIKIERIRLDPVLYPRKQDIGRPPTVRGPPIDGSAVTNTYPASFIYL